MTKAVRSGPLCGEGRVQSQVSSRAVCGNKAAFRQVYLRVLRIFLVGIIPNMLQIQSSIIDAVYCHTINVTLYPLSLSLYSIQAVNTSKIRSTLNYPKYINNQENALQYSRCILFVMFLPKCFGRYCCHLQGDVIITRMENVQIWLIVSPSLHNN
jgi:hypothetical protein